MALSTHEATAALSDLEDIRHRSSTLWRYQTQAPFLFLWAALYVIGYGISYAMPRSAGIAWTVIGIGGGIASWVIGTRIGGGTSSVAKRRAHVLKFGVIVLTITLFITGTFIILPATDPRQVGAFCPLVVGLIYALYGTLLSPRLGAIGLVLGGLTIAGYMLIPGPNFLLWMAAVGGGALAIGGFWLRRV